MTTANRDRQAGPYEPTLRDMLALEIPGLAKISPNGEYIAFTLRRTNWRDNRYEQCCMIVDTRSHEMKVPVELLVYPGFGHPITKPRENHAILHQNLAWFSHYLLDEELELE